MTTETLTTAEGTTQTTEAPAADATNPEATLVEGQEAPKPTTEEVKPGEEAKPEGDKKPEGEEKKPDEEAKPEPVVVKFAEEARVAPAVQEKFTALATAAKLTSEDAQKFADLAPELTQMFNDDLIAQAGKVTEQWRELAINDKELGGGDATVLAATEAAAAKAVKAFATPELRTLLGKFDKVKNPGGTGMGNHPEVVRLFARIGKAISEDNKIITGSTANAPKSPQEILYGDKK